jgi:hypothetical protein
MIDKMSSHIEQGHELKEGRGNNTEVCFTFIRHSQKTSGRIYTEDGLELSESDVSEGGKLRAAKYGKDVLSGRKIGKAYATNLDRTRRTLESAFEAAGINPIIL